MASISSPQFATDFSFTAKAPVGGHGMRGLARGGAWTANGQGGVYPETGSGRERAGFGTV